MTHQRNRKHLYKYLYKWRVADQRSGFEWLNTDVVSNMAPVSGEKQYLLATCVHKKDVDPDNPNVLPELRPQNVKSLPFVSPEYVSYVDNDPPA